MISKEFWILLNKEMLDSLRNRWLILYALMYSVLGLSLSYYSVLGLSYLGFRAFGKVTAALINLSLYLVPLASLSLSSFSIVSERERGTLEILLSQPVSKREVLVSKYLGIVSSIGLATMLGYGIAAWYLWTLLASGDIVLFLAILLTSLLLASALSAVGLLISVVSISRFQALAATILVWLTLVVVYDLLVMGAAIMAGLRMTEITALLLVNPVESARILMIYSLDPTMLVLGPTGIYLARSLGPLIPLLCVGSLTAWAAIALFLAERVFTRQDL